MTGSNAARHCATSPTHQPKPARHSRAAGDLSSWAEGYRPSSERAAQIWVAYRDQVEHWVSAAPAAGVTEARRIASAVLELLAWGMPLFDDLDACMSEEALQQFIRANPSNLGTGALGNVRGRVRRVLAACHNDSEVTIPAEARAPRRRSTIEPYGGVEWGRLVQAASTNHNLANLLAAPDGQITPEDWADCREMAAALGVDLRRKRLSRSVQLRALSSLDRPLGQALRDLALSRTAASELAALLPAKTGDDYRIVLRGHNPTTDRRVGERYESSHVGNECACHCTAHEHRHRPEGLSLRAEHEPQSSLTPGGAVEMPAPTTPTTPVHEANRKAPHKPGPTTTSPRKRRPSARQARLALATVRAEAEARATSFPDAMRTFIREQYRPLPPVSDNWHLLKGPVEQTLAASAVRGEDSMRKHVTHLAYFFAWAHDTELRLGPETLTRPNVGRYDNEVLVAEGKSTRQNRRSRLLKLADQLHPEQAPVKGPALGHRAVAAPYSLSEMAILRRVAMVQPTPELTRQMCLLVGLGAGAGIDSTDLKRLYCCDVIDHGAEIGIEVRVTNLRRSKDNTRHERHRTVWVLREYEDLVRVGVAGLGAKALLLGKNAERANVAASVFARAALHGDVPELAQSRLRSTWLATHLQRTTPLNVLLRAAGLTTARTLVELLEHLPLPADSRSLR